jgi:type II pantothenate kinase
LQATGGGSYKFGDDFQEKLGVSLDKLDEMDSVVSGANFLLEVVVSCYLQYFIAAFLLISHRQLAFTSSDI